MVEFSIKQRFLFLLGSILILILIIASLYSGVDAVFNYLSFPDVITYSYGGVCSIFSPLLLGPALFFTYSQIVKGVRLADKKAMKITKFIVLCFFLAIFSSWIFSAIYVGELNKRGYVACKGIPSGFTPGSATKYALHSDLCDKKRGS